MKTGVKKLTLVLLACAGLSAQIRPQPAYFSGTGLQDCRSGGAINESALNHQFIIQIQSAGTPDHWRWSEDGGGWSSPIALTGTPQLVADGVTFGCSTTTGHTTGDQWTIAVNVNGSVAPLSFVPTGVGAVPQGVQDTLQHHVEARGFGAKCDGIHDDTAAIQAAINSLPLIATTAYGNIRSGAVELPYVGGNNTIYCVISPPFITSSPRVKIWSQGGFVDLRAAANSSPAGAKLTVTGATNATPIVISTSTNPISAGLVNGDTVVCQGIGGNLEANSWYGFAAGPWIISSVTSSGFTLTGSQGSSGYTSGGTCIKGTEKFMLTIFNANGTGSPNFNFDVALENVALDASNAGNEFVSGVMCNCSIGTRVVRTDIVFGYRGFVTAPGGVDNITLESVEMDPSSFSGNGPDPTGLFITGSTGTNTITATNLKFMGGFGGLPNELYTGQTPAIVLGQSITNTHLEGLNFEQVGWPIYGGFDLYDVSVTGITAVADTPTMGSFPQVVTYNPSEQLVYTSNARFEGVYKGYACGQLIEGACDPALAVPTSSSDGKYYPIAYDAVQGHTLAAEIDVTGPRPYLAAPSGTGPTRSVVFQIDYGNSYKDNAGLGAYLCTGASWTPGGGCSCVGGQGVFSGTLTLSPMWFLCGPDNSSGGGNWIPGAMNRFVDNNPSSANDALVLTMPVPFNSGVYANNGLPFWVLLEHNLTAGSTSSTLTINGTALAIRSPFNASAGITTGYTASSGSPIPVLFEIESGVAYPIGNAPGGVQGITASTGLTNTGTASNPILALQTTGVTAGTYGSGTSVPVTTVNAEGQISGVVSTAIAGITVTAGSGLSGGGTVSPGGSVTLTNTSPGGTVAGGTFSCGAGLHIASITISATGVPSGTCN